MNRARPILAAGALLLCGCAVFAQVISSSSSNNAFGLDLYRQLAKDPGNAEKNLWFSPYSLTSALTMAAEGARENTLAQMVKVLRFSDSARGIPLLPIHEGMAALDRQLDTTATGATPREKTYEGAPLPYQLTVANALWGDRQYPFEPKFVETIHKYYGTAGVFPVDFLHDAESARLKINTWTGEQTRQRIKDLMGPGTVHSATRLVLTNAAYFKGAWVQPFQARSTTNQPFHVTTTKDVRASLMEGGGGLDYLENPQLKLISMPYVGSTGRRDVSMVVVLPRQISGLSAIEQSVTDSKLAEWIALARRQPVRVFLPKFTMTAQFQLKGVLESMGMSDPFSATRANFAGISPRATQDRLFVGGVIHKAYINVDENGTEAAAATALSMVAGGLPQGPPAVFRADRPFLFMIRHNPSGAILFLGRVLNPSNPQ